MMDLWAVAMEGSSTHSNWIKPSSTSVSLARLCVSRVHMNSSSPAHGSRRGNELHQLSTESHA